MATEAPATIDLDTLLQQASLLVELAPPPSAQAPADDPAHALRTRLAVRGWINPHRILGDFDEARTRDALNAVAAEVDSVFSLRPGEWYLSVGARRRIVGARGPDALREELKVVRCAEDGDDPTRRAFSWALALAPLPSLERIPDEELRALGNVLDWLADLAIPGPGRGAIAAELDRRTGARDLERLTASPLVGERHKAALATLLGRAGAPPGQGLSVSYLYGPGGAGKSTVLAFLQQRLQQTGPVCLRLDFDNPLVNPLDPGSLGIAMLEQLAQAFPKGIATYHRLIGNLREQRQYEREFSPGVRSRRGGRPVEKSELGSLASEEADTGAGSARLSILFGLLDPAVHPEMARSLVLILDTAELLMTFGDAATTELVGWIRSITHTLGARDLRLVVAGRDPPGERGESDLLDRLRPFGIVHEPILLPELEPQEAAMLLRNCGIEDPQTAYAAALAVPGNPLLLRITADTLRLHPELAEEVREAHAAARIDARSANTYLARRIVAHLADPVARPYLLPAMYLPAVTRQQLRDIVLPLVDGGEAQRVGLVRRVFAALRSAHWLTRPGPDPDVVNFHPDLRTLVLRLLAADPAQADFERALRERAVAVHAARRSARDRAYRIYHQALLGLPMRVRRPDVVADYLRHVLGDLPDDVRTKLLGRPGTALRDDDGREAWTADQWQLYLEGDAHSDGEGARLLKRDHAGEALRLYRSRPTRPPGLPPGFVIRALADLGEWESDEVQVEPILEQMAGALDATRVTGEAMSRIYWVTRFALLRDQARLSPYHVDFLSAACRKLSGASLSTMPALIAVGEGAVGTSIMPRRMRTGKGAIESATRVYLVQGRRTGEQVKFTPHLDSLVVFQRDWQMRLQREARSYIRGSDLDWVQKEIDRLHGQPIAAVNRLLAKFRKAVAVRWDGEDVGAGVLLLRGQTVEFLRPLRWGLAELYGDAATREQLAALFESIIARMSVRPEEFEPATLRDRLERAPEAWMAAFVNFVDRARLLPLLCARITKLAPRSANGRKAALIAKSFLAWERAICGEGHTSSWSA